MQELDLESSVIYKERRSPLDPEIVEILNGRDCLGKTVWQVLPDELKNSDAVVQVTLNGQELDDEALHKRTLTLGDKLTARVVQKEAGTIVGFLVFKVIIPVLIGIALNEIIQAIVGSPRRKKNKDSPTYTFDTPQNTTENGTPISLVYGKARVAGHILQAKTSILPDGKSQLSVLLGLGEGGERGWKSICGFTSDQDDVTPPSTLLVNSSSVESYKDVTVSVRLGTKHHKIIPGFQDTIVLTTPFSSVVNQATPFTYTTVNDVHSVELKLKFPQGLFSAGTSGINNKKVEYGIKYRRVGEVTWESDVSKTFSDKTTSEFDISYRIDNLDHAKYEIEVRRISADDTGAAKHSMFEIKEFNEIINDDLAYPGKALLAVKALATDQLHGTPPNFSAICEGLLVRVYTTTTAYTYAWSENRSWVILDLLINPRSPLSKVVNISEIDIQSFIDYAAYGDATVRNATDTGSEKRITTSLVLDTARDAWDWIYDLAVSGNASIYKTGGYYRIKANSTLSPTMTFNSSNMFNLVVGYTPLSERVNYIETKFVDEELDYKQNVAVARDETISGTANYIKDSLELVGTCRRSEAVRVSNHRINANKLSTRYASWETSKIGLRCEPGDLVELADERVLWGTSTGRIVSSTPFVTALDREVTLETGKLYYIRVWKAAGTFEQQQIASGAGAYTSVAIAGNWLASPANGDVWSIGEATNITRQVQVIDIKEKDDGNFSLFGAEYDSDIFSDTIVKLPATSTVVGFDARQVPGDVTNLRATERVMELQDGSLQFAIDVSWSAPVNPVVAGYLVWMRDSSLSTFPSSPVSAIVKGNYFRIDGDIIKNSTYNITVTPITVFHVRKSPELTPRVTLTILGSTDRPDDVTGYQVSRVGDTLVHSWNAVLDQAVTYEIRAGANWDSGVLVIKNWSASVYETRLFFASTTAAYNQTFLVKAKNTVGVYSLNAASAAITIDPKIDTNLVVARNEQVLASVAVTGATNATPIVITANNHGFTGSDIVTIYGVGGNTAANGRWAIGSVTTNTFSLTSSVGNGAYTSGGTAIKSWNGIRTNFDVGGSGPTEYLQLNDSTAPYTATYETEEINLGATYRAIITVLAQITQIDTTMTWAAANFQWGSAEAQNRTWSGPVAANNLTLLIESKFGTSSPISEGYATFVPVERSIRYARFRVTLSTTDIKFTGRLTALQMLFDVPDILDGDEGVEIWDGSEHKKDVTYNKTFTSASNIALQVTVRNLPNGYRLAIPAGNRSVSGFRAQIIEGAGAGTIVSSPNQNIVMDWIARGY